jgi:hypothetical protein
LLIDGFIVLRLETSLTDILKPMVFTYF